MQKAVLLAAVLAALFASFAQSADVQMPSTPAKSLDEAHTERMEAATVNRVMIRTPEDPDADAAGIKILIGAQDLLKQPTALVDQNTIATGNNIAITRSNIIFTAGTQSDRLALVDAIEALIRTSDADNDADSDSDSDARLMTAILAVVGAKASDDRMTAQVRAVLNCRKHDRAMLRQCIVALVNTMPSSWSDGEVAASDDEAAYDAYYGKKSVVVNPPGPGVYGKKSVVVNPPGPGVYGKKSVVVNPPGPGVYGKKSVVGRRRYYPEDTTAKTPSEEYPSEDEQRLVSSYRVAFRYPFAGGFRYGWRYPLSYWNMYGRRFYPATCGFGRVFGPYYYC